MLQFSIFILSFNWLYSTLLLLISATSFCISTPTNFVFVVFADNKIDKIPVPLPKSATIEFGFIFLAKSVNNTLSIPKQNPSVF